MFWEKTNLEKQIRQLKSNLTDKDLAYTKLQKRLDEAIDDNEYNATLYTNLKQEFDNTKKTLNNIQNKHNAELEMTKKSVNKQINAALASVGVNCFANESFSVDTEISDIEALSKFQNLKGQEKTEFYSANKAKITRALLAKV